MAMQYIPAAPRADEERSTVTVTEGPDVVVHEQEPYNAEPLLLSLRELQTTRPALAAFPIVLAVVIAFATLLYGATAPPRCARPLPCPLAPRPALITLGVALTALALTSEVSLLL